MSTGGADVHCVLMLPWLSSSVPAFLTENGDVPVKDVRLAFGQTLLSKTRDELPVGSSESFKGHCVEGSLMCRVSHWLFGSKYGGIQITSRAMSAWGLVWRILRMRLIMGPFHHKIRERR